MRKHQRGVLKGIGSVLWLPGVVESCGLLAAVQNRNQEQEPVMMKLFQAESSRSNQELFAPTKASLHYPERGFISVF